ncbi:hypothetical protein [uncultured Aquimarina sp.]|uniref:hypothetical protein n=1 Tax=uncultured Aquimarina sp. TaxID=575652 RepID=UPI0026325004|nr:hypothetical protein [uncultured Aquimarina sp.]
MKKITLLLVAAVFAIGIQSCSTDEIGIEEETKQELSSKKLTSNNLLEGPTSYCPIFVVFTDAISPSERDQIRFLHKISEVGFGDFTYTTTECYNVEIWNVDCSKILLPYNTDYQSVENTTAIYTARTNSDANAEDDEDSPIDSLNSSNYIYLEGNVTDCVDVLERIIYESSF